MHGENKAGGDPALVRLMLFRFFRLRMGSQSASVSGQPNAFQSFRVRGSPWRCGRGAAASESTVMDAFCRKAGRALCPKRRDEPRPTGRWTRCRKFRVCGTLRQPPIESRASTCACALRPACGCAWIVPGEARRKACSNLPASERLPNATMVAPFSIS